MGIDAGDAVEEFIAYRLAGDGRSGSDDLLNHGGVPRRWLLLREPFGTAAARAGTCDVVHVLDHGGQARQRSRRRTAHGRFEIMGNEERSAHVICPLYQSRIFHAVPSCDAGPAQDRFKGAPNMIDPVRHARQITMHGDRHELRPLGRFHVEAVELIHDPPMQLVGGMILQRHHHDVVQLEIVRQGDHRSVRRLERHGLVVEHPVADILDAGSGQMIERVEGLRQSRPQPAARSACPKIWK